MTHPFDIVREFEREICAYTGAPFCVTVSSCTMALRLCLDWQHSRPDPDCVFTVNIPRRTYLSVPMQIKHAGFSVSFRDEMWTGQYQLRPFRIWDSARWFSGNMFGYCFEEFKEFGPSFQCVSFHATKTLGIKRKRYGMWDGEKFVDSPGSPWDIEQGGAILHNCEEADSWFRSMRFDGRVECEPITKDNVKMLGHHCYLSPATARLGLELLKNLPQHNDPIPNDPYPDLSKFEIFK